MNSLSPFGSGNSEPKFVIEDIKVIKTNIVGNNHIKSIENRNGWICGLGHGINKDTPEKNVHLFIENIRKEFC